MNMDFSEDYETMEEVIAILQCAEEATTEDHIRTTIGLAVGLLLGVAHDLAPKEGKSDET